MKLSPPLDQQIPASSPFRPGNGNIRVLYALCAFVVAVSNYLDMIDKFITIYELISLVAEVYLN
jgi:hypothetical protein